MSLWSRIQNVFGGERPLREIDEEFESHIAEAIDQGREPEEARRSLGSALRAREQSRDVRLVAWLDALRANVIFGWHQILKSKVASASAILSHDYWARQFGRDPNALGRTFRMGDGAPPGPVLAYFLNVSPGWMGVIKIPIFAGRDFRVTDHSFVDSQENSAALVNETFSKTFFHGENPIRISFNKGGPTGDRIVMVGVVRDAPYRNLREVTLPVASVPMQSAGTVRSASFIVRGVNPATLGTLLRRAVPLARPEFRVSNVRTQEELMRAQTVRERLLAMQACSSPPWP